MNQAAEKLSNWFGSTPFIIFHIVWFGAWFPLGGNTDRLTMIVSLEAIFLSLFILRAENIQGNRMERSVKRAEVDTKKDLEKSDDVLKLLKRRDNG